MFDLAGRVAVVTGGNRGIGLGIARGLVEAGAAVVLAGRDLERSEAAARELTAVGGRALPIAVDVLDEAACHAMIERAVQELGGLDILVNNAGTNIRKAPQEYSLAEWRLLLETNLTSAFTCSQAAYPHFLARGGGKIINIGSMLSIFGASFGAPYGASKGGLVQLTKALAVAWAKDHIQVNAILPGWIDTELTQRARQDVSSLHEYVLQRTPAGRWGEPSDMAGTAVFLSSPASDFVTGAEIPVDGGYSSQV